MVNAIQTILAAEKGDTIMQIESNITIKRPITKVFDFASHPENTKLWQPEVIEHQLLTDGPMGLGFKMRHVSTFMGRRISTNLEITEFIPNQKITFHVLSGTLPYTIYYIFDSCGKSTRFTYSAVMPSKWYLALLQPLIKSRAKRVIEGDLERLKLIMEKEN